MSVTIANLRGMMETPRSQQNLSRVSQSRSRTDASLAVLEDVIVRAEGEDESTSILMLVVLQSSVNFAFPAFGYVKTRVSADS
jgi:hypothetical protein